MKSEETDELYYYDCVNGGKKFNEYEFDEQICFHCEQRNDILKDLIIPCIKNNRFLEVEEKIEEYKNIVAKFNL